MFFLPIVRRFLISQDQLLLQPLRGRGNRALRGAGVFCSVALPPDVTTQLQFEESIVCAAESPLLANLTVQVSRR